MTGDRKLIVHVGAEKCASSSIQESLKALRTLNESVYNYYELNPWTLANPKVASAPAGPNSLVHYIDSFLYKQPAYGTVILSHEVLCRLPGAVQLIMERAVECRSFSEIYITGYTRGHSSFFASAFKQWHFRNKTLLHDNISLFKSLSLDYERFTAIERYMFAKAWSCVSQQTRPLEMSWHNYYSILFKAAEKYKAQSLTIYSNHIPSTRFPYSIFNDFLQAARISVKSSDVEACESRSNSSFDPMLVQAISDIICDPSLDQSCMPTPHAQNGLLFRLGESFNALTSIEDLPQSSELLKYCSDVIDDTYYAGNLQYCQLMNVNSDFFNPFSNVSLAANDLLHIAAAAESCRDLRSISASRRAAINLFYSSIREAMGNEARKRD